MLFSGPMVRALLAGTKTQTRRVVKPQPTGFVGGPGVTLTDGSPAPLTPLDETVEPYGREICCPYGQPGDRLWVRETWDFLPDGVLANGKAATEPNQAVIRYWADTSLEFRTVPHDFNPMIYNREKRRPSIHMPRWASRITLEITGVRVERLQDISEADAMAEGVYTDPACPARDAFESLWEQINGPGSWDANPWVWVVEFKVVTP